MDSHQLTTGGFFGIFTPQQTTTELAKMEYITCKYTLDIPASGRDDEGIKRRISFILRNDHIKQGSLLITPTQTGIDVIWDAHKNGIEMRSLNSIKLIAKELGCKLIPM